MGPHVPPLHPQGAQRSQELPAEAEVHAAGLSLPAAQIFSLEKEKNLKKKTQKTHKLNTRTVLLANSDQLLIPRAVIDQYVKFTVVITL